MNARITILQDVATYPQDGSTAAGNDGTGPEAFDAEILLLEQPLMQLAARQHAGQGVAVRIDTPEAVWLGDVEKCSASSGGFTIFVRLRHVLRDFETLARLAERFGSPAPKGAFEKEVREKGPKGTPVQI